MKKFLLFYFLPFFAMAQDAVVSVPIVAGPAVELDFLQKLIQGLAGSHPWILSALAVIGIVRVINKPLFSLLRTYVNTTSSAKDNELLDSVEKSAIYKGITYLLDWFFSIKPSK